MNLSPSQLDMMATLSFPYSSYFGTEDVMELSSDSIRRPDDDDGDIDIDLDLTGEQQQGIVDEEMVEEYDDPIMPHDKYPAIRVGPEPSDAPMEDQGTDADSADQGLIRKQVTQNGNDASEGPVQRESSEEDLLDEIDDKIEDDLPAQERILSTHEQSREPTKRDTSEHTDNTIPKVNLGSKHLESEAKRQNAHVEGLKSGETAPMPGNEYESDSDVVDSMHHVESIPNLQSLQERRPEEKQKIDVQGQHRINGAQEHAARQLDDSHDVPSSDDESNDDPPAQSMHPVQITYQHEKISLFPPQPEDQNSNTFLLRDEALARGGVLNLLTACREVLGESIEQDEELEISIQGLDLKIGEASTDFSNVSFADVIETFVTLHHNDGITNPPALQAYLYTVSSHSHRWEQITTLASEGKGLSQIPWTGIGESWNLEANGGEAIQTSNFSSKDINNSVHAIRNKEYHLNDDIPGDSKATNTSQNERAHEQSPDFGKDLSNFNTVEAAQIPARDYSDDHGSTPSKDTVAYNGTVKHSSSSLDLKDVGYMELGLSEDKDLYNDQADNFQEGTTTVDGPQSNLSISQSSKGDNQESVFDDAFEYRDDDEYHLEHDAQQDQDLETVDPHHIAYQENHESDHENQSQAKAQHAGGTGLSAAHLEKNDRQLHQDADVRVGALTPNGRINEYLEPNQNILEPREDLEDIEIPRPQSSATGVDKFGESDEQLLTTSSLLDNYNRDVLQFDDNETTSEAGQGNFVNKADEESEQNGTNIAKDVASTLISSPASLKRVRAGEDEDETIEPHSQGAKRARAS